MGIFENTSSEIKLYEDTAWLKADTEGSYILKSLGSVKAFKAFAAIYRQQVFFQYTKTGADINEIPPETQWLLIEHQDNTYTIVIPLVKEPFRCALKGEGGELWIYCETGDDAQEASMGMIAYYISGNNPYKMMREAGKKISELLDNCRTRSEKPTPEFVNYFGWCTWDSFYEKVTAEDVKTGLKNFKDGGFVPGVVILDDGWQSVEPVKQDRGLHQLCAFEANEKFEHNLSKTVDCAKNDFGVKLFMVWHAIMGYWGGVYPKSPQMAEFDVKLKVQNHSKTMFEVNPKYSKSLYFPYGFVNPKKAFAFYNAYHSYLRCQGVDGVKVDVQSALEGVGAGEGGRVSTVKTFRQGLEASVNINFKGNLINCMSCSNDHILNTLSTNVMRSSDDFLPDNPKTHGVHVYRNAFNSIFMGEFLICDWDMFQTQHKYGEFHAASRAISGGPIYVSDKVGEHDFKVIERLTMAEARLPLCTHNARPTMDSLFIDSEEMDDIFKIFNYNKYTGVIGAFNLTDNKTLSKKVSPMDIDGFDDGIYAVYATRARTLLKYRADEKFDIDLEPVSFELYAVSEIIDGFAPIGLCDKYNCGGTILEMDRNENMVSITVGDGGMFLAFCDKRPLDVLVNGKTAEHEYDNDILKIKLENRGKNKLLIIS